MVHKRKRGMLIVFVYSSKTKQKLRIGRINSINKNEVLISCLVGSNRWPFIGSCAMAVIQRLFFEGGY